MTYFDQLHYQVDLTGGVDSEILKQAVAKEEQVRREAIENSRNHYTYITFAREDDGWVLTQGKHTTIWNPDQRKFEEESNEVYHEQSKKVKNLPIVVSTPGIVSLGTSLDGTLPHVIGLHPDILKILIYEGSVPYCHLQNLFTRESPVALTREQEQERINVGLNSISGLTCPIPIVQTPITLIGKFKSLAQEVATFFKWPRTGKEYDSKSTFFTFNEPAWIDSSLVLLLYTTYMKDKVNSGTVSAELKNQFLDCLEKCQQWFNDQFAELVEKYYPQYDIENFPKKLGDIKFPEGSNAKFMALNREFLTRLFHVYEVGLLKLSKVENYKDDTEKRELNANGLLIEWPTSHMSFTTPQEASVVISRYLRTNDSVWQMLMTPVTSTTMPLSVEPDKEALKIYLHTNNLVHSVKQNMDHINTVLQHINNDTKNPQQALINIQNSLCSWDADLVVTTNPEAKIFIGEDSELSFLNGSSISPKNTFFENLFWYLHVLSFVLDKKMKH